ncbi:MAG TPA: alcohol dehydrogenase catalytic domain-containing protein [Chthonomonadaceae bacterium]|nr:alcohol dehydrogenase catalytic domain-containing protein [Chthonomonadaceae bacterium]
MQGLHFLGDRRLALESYPDPHAGPGEVVVKIGRAAVCGTDIHKYRAPAQYIETLPDGSALIVGHEPAGWIAEIGEGVTGLQTGDRVLLAGVVGCGRCAWCHQGYNTACEAGVSGLGWKRHGCDATHIVWPAANVFVLPEKMSLDCATVLTCAGGTAYTTLRETDLRGEDRLAIVGLGPVGLCLLLLAKSLGVRTVGVDVAPNRLEQALNLGLDCAVDASQEDAVAAVRRWSGGRGCEVVAECVGKPETKHQALEMAATRGRVAIAGLGGEPLSLNTDRFFIGGQLRLIGILATPLRYFAPLIQRTVEYDLPFERLITHHFPLEAAAEAFAVMESGRSGKVLFDVAEKLNG